MAPSKVRCRPLIAAAASSRRPARAVPPQATSSIILRAGDGLNYPVHGQACAIHYDAYLPDNSLWDSSRKRGVALRFRLGMGQVIDGLDQGIMALSVGERVRLTIPSELAYGARGFPGLVPPDTDVVFDLELLEVV